MLFEKIEWLERERVHSYAQIFTPFSRGRSLHAARITKKTGFRKYGWLVVKTQLKEAFDALKAWRGEAARAHLRGMFAGLRGIPKMLRKRRQIQAMRTVSIDQIEMSLMPPAGK
jgi:hypothetical protein